MFASPWKTCPQSSATAGAPVDHPEPLEQLECPPPLVRHLATRRFPQNRSPQHHLRVARANDGTPLTPCHRRPLFSDQPPHIPRGLLGPPPPLLHSRRHHANPAPAHPEQPAS